MKTTPRSTKKTPNFMAKGGPPGIVPGPSTMPGKAVVAPPNVRKPKKK